MAPLVLLSALCVVLGASALSLFGAYRRRFNLARLSALAVAGVIVSYGGTLMAYNATMTRERAIPLGVPEPFCGFYLDCHISAALLRVERFETLGTAPYEARARDTFHVVTLRLASNARRATLRLASPDVWVEDTTGGRHTPSPLADSVVSSAGVRPPALDTPLPAGTSFTTTLVFDLPRTAAPFRLHIAEGGLPDRVLEKLLLGDSDALFARPAWFDMR